MNVLSVKNYSKRFFIHHLAREISAFANLNFDLSAGQFLLVSGANGVGKSTLLRCLYRSYRPTCGEALYHSQYGVVDLASLADVDMALLRKQEIGFVTQFLRPRPRITALQLVSEPLLLQGLSAEVAQERAERLLDSFGLKTDLWHAYPTTFSGGEQQKVNLARALIRPHRLLLLDEPTASLDVQARASLHRELARLKTEGVAIMGVFHHPEDVQDLLDNSIELVLESVDREVEHDPNLLVK